MNDNVEHSKCYWNGVANLYYFRVSDFKNYTENFSLYLIFKLYECPEIKVFTNLFCSPISNSCEI